MGIVEKTKTIQEDNVKAWTRPDGSLVNVSLIDKINIHNNSLQVINQYVPEGGAFDNRYDVTILVNGLPARPCGIEASRCKHKGCIQPD